MSLSRSPSARVLLSAALCALTIGLPAYARAEVVFSTDFESGLPAQITGQGVQIESVQGLAGLGAPGNQFGGNLLRYYTQTLYDTTLTLTDLPSHTYVSLGFLLALIDSWDGTELMEVVVDGQLLFSNWFQLASGDDSSYLAPPGGLLSSGINRGWSAGSWYDRDRALDLSVEPALIDIPHTASTLTVVWRLGAVSGGAAANWQGGMDESWGIDNLRVSVSGATSAAPLAEAGIALLDNAPNPFNPSTRISYRLPDGGAQVALRIYDLSGHMVRTLVDGQRAGGDQAVMWDGRSDDGRIAPGGVYVCRLAAGGFEQARKMILLK